MRKAAFVALGAAALGALLFVYRDEPAETVPPASLELAPARVARSAEPIPPEHMPPPFRDRKVQPPDATAPAPSETAAFCDEKNWSGLDLRIGGGADGVFRVDDALWSRTLTETRAGIASWLSKCHWNGGLITIVADATGATLATYDPEGGLRLAPRQADPSGAFER